MSNPLITIGVSTYNRKDLLRESLQSLLKQDFTDYEIVVVDDGSTDGTGDMVKAEFPTVRYFYQENAGDAAAKNHAAREARGRYLVFNDSDDRFYTDTLSRLYSPLKTHPESCSYGQYTHLNLQGEERPAKLKLKEFPSGNILDELIAHIIVHCCGFMMPTALFLQCGGFDEKLQVGHDYKLTLQMAKDHEFFALSAPAFQRRRHPGNLSGHSYEKIQTILQVIEDFAAANPELAIVHKKALAKRRAKLQANLAREARHERRGKALICYHLRMSLHYHFSLKILLILLWKTRNQHDCCHS